MLRDCWSIERGLCGKAGSPNAKPTIFNTIVPGLIPGPGPFAVCLALSAILPDLLPATALLTFAELVSEII